MEEEKYYHCDVCDEKFSENFNLKEHQKIHINSEEKPFTCEIRCKGYSRKDHLKRHWKKIHPERETIDDSNKYSKIYSRISNANINTGEKLFTCEICCKRFSQKGNLKTHQKKIHPEIETINESNLNSGEKPFTCEICCMRFSRKGNLKRHQKKIHPEIETINESNKSSKIYSKISNLNINSGEKPFTCEICCMRFSQKGNLKTHQKKIHPEIETINESNLNINSGKKPFTCEICCMRFSQKGNLKRHKKKIHPEIETINKSNKSSKIYSKMSNLNINSREKPFTCEICCKRFSQKDNLKTHQKKIHPEIETVNKSNKYSKIYSSISELKRFLNISVDTKSFTCEECYKEFSCIDHLKKHQLTHKKIKPEENSLISEKNSHISEENCEDFSEIIDEYCPPEFYICEICSEKFSRSLDLKRHQSTHTTV